MRRQDGADDDRQRHETKGKSEHLRDGERRQFLAGGSGADNGQQDESEDVVDDGGAEDDLRFIGFHVTEVGENARGDADRGCRQRRAEEDRHGRWIAEEDADARTGDERQRYARDGYRHRGAADGQKTLEIRLQADQKEEQDHAELREKVQHGIVRIDEAESGDADDDATDHFAKDGGLPDALGKLTEKFGGGEDRQQREEQARDRHDERSLDRTAARPFAVPARRVRPAPDDFAMVIARWAEVLRGSLETQQLGGDLQ